MFIDELQTLRVRAGLTISKVAREADLDRGTVKRAERHRPARVETLYRIVNALNDLYYSERGIPLNPEAVIQEKSRWGQKVSGGAEDTGTDIYSPRPIPKPPIPDDSE